MLQSNDSLIETILFEFLGSENNHWQIIAHVCITFTTNHDM